MKFIISLSVILGCTFADSSLDWSRIKPNYVTVDPLPTAPKYPVPRVIGGTEASPNSFPYQAALIINLGSFCGGILISNQHVVTAAHCTNSAIIVRVLLGAHNVNQDEPNQISITTTRVVNHPDYSSANFLNDISIVILPNPVELSDVIRPVSLAPVTAGDFAGSQSVLSGWGRTSDASNAISPTLQYVNLSILSNVACAGTYGNTIQSSHICTSGAGSAGTVGACNGDSGGPLVVGDNVVGVVSFGTTSCAAGNPTVFARITSYRLWINEVTGV